MSSASLTSPPPHALSPPPPTWDPSPVDAAESALLALLSPSLPYTKRSLPVGPAAFMNSISAGSPAHPHLVLAHGWGAGLALFARNLPALARRHRVHLIDWLGFGGSARPAYCLGASPEQGEDFFLDAFEEWLHQMRRTEDGAGLRRFTFVGHSMGAFLAVGYALRRRGDVVNLVLASPVGVPRAPRDKMPPPSAPWRKRLLFWVLFALWERHYTPQMVVRCAPTEGVGRMLAAWLVESRFPAAEAAVREAIADYFYQMCCAPPCGEYSLSTVLESGAYARRPLVDKLPKVDVPVMFLYGDRDWMDKEGGEEVRKGMKVQTELHIVENAGHHLYYDNPTEFVRLVDAACAGARGRKEM